MGESRMVPLVINALSDCSICEGTGLKRVSVHVSFTKHAQVPGRVFCQCVTTTPLERTCLCGAEHRKEHQAGCPKALQG